MIKFTELLSPENIRQGIICSSKKRLFEIISDIVVPQIENNLNTEDNVPYLNEFECFENLFAREKLGCTSLGNGVAIPRAKIPNSDHAIAVFLQLGLPLDYEAPDKREVDLILAILIPENMCADYSLILPELAEKLSDKNLCKQLRTAQNKDEIWQIFNRIDGNINTQAEGTETVIEKDI
ncbi:PTS IIA-like nitrogen regulatory protein PtsN [Mannheimia massilioguelmaensis]|uniref:PTS IIA-like nitrogen regulatory protein PtsN n=1 Tax=Mannheimia massilioguelmaensis TaxID=1604354 RepID=UPI0005C98835|nr:PTS IIA-like nitrogen regulatory protein PtsN [Mannheimia massilioguelmaensis]